MRSIRDSFPIFSTNAYKAYLDNAATTHKPHEVIKAMNDFYSTAYAPVHRGSYQLAEQATIAYEQTREATAEFINAQYASEIVFTKSATESINMVAYAWALNNIKKDDEILISPLEHHANILPWHMVSKKTGAHVVVAPLELDGTLDTNRFIACISHRTKLVSFVHMSHVTGILIDPIPIINAAKSYKARVLLDAAQSIAHGLIDVQRHKVDFLVFSTHKVFGPNGLGVLYIAQHIVNECQPFLYGGGMLEQIENNHINYLPPPHCFEAGTPPSAEVIGWRAALEYSKTLDWDSIRMHEQNLISHALDQLSLVPLVSFIGDKARLYDNFSIISIMINSYHHHDVAAFLSSKNCAIRAGNHCAQPLFSRLNQPGSIRLSLSIYSELQEIDYFVESLHELLTSKQWIGW